MAVNWSVAVGVRDVSLELMRERHEHLIKNAVRVEYLHRDDAPKQGGRDRLGGVAKITSMGAFLAGRDTGEGDPFFVMWIPEHVWQRLDDRQKDGLVDHLLCMMDAGQDEEGAVKLAKNVPDFVGFNRNIQDFGFWWDGAQDMFEAMRRAGQLSLDLAAGERSTRPVLEITGRGELAADDLGEVPVFCRVLCECGLVFDNREFDDCPGCDGSVVAATVADSDAAREPVEGEYPQGGAPADLLVDEGEAPVSYLAADTAAAGDGIPRDEPVVPMGPGGRKVEKPALAERMGRGRWSSRNALRDFQAAQQDGEGESPLVGGLVAGAE
jgi:hypothetical protein